MFVAGLRSVLFAISIDNAEFNVIRRARGLEDLVSRTTGALGSAPPSATGGVYVAGVEEPRPVIGSPDENKTGACW